MNFEDILNLLNSRKVIIIAGEFGRGKTLSGIALIWFLNHIFNYDYILSNIPINFKHVIIKSLNQSKEFDNEHKKTIIFHDEMQRDFGARDFLSSSAKIVSKFSMDFRKDDSKLVSTIQFMDRLDSSLNELIQIIIIPTFVKEYSLDIKEDTEIRLKNKDFIVEWRVIDKLYESVYTVKINLYPFLFMYDTNFKPFPIVINHDEFTEKQEKNLSIKKYNSLLLSIENKLNNNIINWNDGLKKLKRKR